MKILCILTILFSFIYHSLYCQGSVLLVGGGQENYNDWSDIPYSWFVQKADSGKIINIDVSTVSTWYPDYFKWLGAVSTSHEYQISTRTAANDSATYYELISARGIFIEGGDQWQYISTWKETLVEDAIHYVFSHGGVIGGTSAGLAILGEIVFDAKFGTAYPDQVAYNPYHSRVSFTDDFLHILPHVFTDSHFHTRARLGRFVPMLARRIQDYSNDDIIGIGVDENTAFCVDNTLTGIAYGEGTVTILFKSDHSYIKAVPGQPPTFTNIKYFQLNHSAAFNLSSRTLVDPGQYLQGWSAPTPFSPTYSDTVLNGSDASTAELGEIVIGNLTSSTLNAWRGQLTQSAGTAVIPHSVIIPKLWNNLDLAENRFIAGMYGIATHPHFVAIYLDDNTQTPISNEGVLTADKLLYILDSYGASHSGFIQFRNTNYPGLIDATLHFLGNGDSYNLTNHEAIVRIKLTKNPQLTTDFELKQNYPNPFNSTTIFDYRIPHRGTLSLEIYNSNGELVQRINHQFQNAGTYSEVWNASDLPSGVYFYRLGFDNRYISRKCILLR